MKPFAIRGDGGAVEITVLAYERGVRDAAHASDANWLNANADVRAASLAGTGVLAISTNEIHAFESELRTLLGTMSGSASLTTDEESIGIVIRMNRRGGAVVRAQLRVNGQPGGTLAVEFESDQSCLTQTLSELQQVIAFFPIR